MIWFLNIKDKEEKWKKHMKNNLGNLLCFGTLKSNN